jgi:hypothetical protein
VNVGNGHVYGHSAARLPGSVDELRTENAASQSQVLLHKDSMHRRGSAGRHPTSMGSTEQTYGLLKLALGLEQKRPAPQGVSNSEYVLQVCECDPVRDAEPL